MRQRQTSSIFITLSMVLFSFGLSTDSGAFKLPDTGQTKCYQAVSPYAEISCPSPGDPLAQDGSYNINPMSYTDNGNGTVTDNNTGLMWQKQDDGDTYNWYEASGTYHETSNPTSINVCGELRTGGYTDWRLPSKKELVTIVNYAIPYPAPMIDPVFSNTKLPPYWSSTPGSNNTSIAWFVSFALEGVITGLKSAGHFVRCVRGGPYPSQSFIDNGNKTVTDIKTGLIWQQETGQGDWAFALSFCEGLTLANQSDWRLPNIKELESLTDATRYNPAIDTVFFPNPGLGFYWSSTTFATNPANAEAIYINYGTAADSGKFYNYFDVRCVRAGQSGSLVHLDIFPAGAGSGSVVSWPAGIDCGLACSAFYPSGSVVVLTATPAAGGSIFLGWSDTDCSDGFVLLDSDKSCTATFDLCPGTTRARIGPTNYYDSISLAYAGAADSGDTIEAMASNQQEELDFNQGKIVALIGGFDCSFDPLGSYTTITGSLAISSGVVTLANIVIQ